MNANMNFTLSEVLDSCDDWETFCEEQGWDLWAVNEGGGDVWVSLTVEEAIKYGIMSSILSDLNIN